jgi:23S rRNA (pseudouridine1915-N3)-methyltransferase
MLSIRLICVGKMKEKHYIAAFNEYEKRLLPCCKFETLELAEEKLPPSPADAEISAALAREAVEIRRNIPSGAFTVAMCIEGKALSSTGLAELFNDCANTGKSRVCFVVGSSNGLDEGLKNSADFKLSMSEMTFPHHLARVMLAEQIYRGIMINKGSKYHK